jgi:hypothetical protein
MADEITTNNSLVTDTAFAGVNYMEALAKVGGTGSLKGDFGKLGSLIGTTDNGIIQHNVSSIFNKFTVFQYSPLNAGSKYRAEGHFIGFSSNLKDSGQYEADDAAADPVQKAIIALNASGITDPEEQTKALKAKLEQWEKVAGPLRQKAKNFKANQEGILSNPSATKLKQWGANISAGTAVGFQPYALTDFMYCKDYGKVPNNRLVTLRRYPFPIADSLRLGQADQRKNAIPIAQAVTWFGSDTLNDLNKLGIFAWDIPWESIAVSEQEITGNEVTFSELLSTLQGLPGGPALKTTLEAAYATFSGSDQNIQELSGYDAKMQLYQKNLYTTGPYWNRIYGPVNVIDKSSRRKRGMQETNSQTGMTIKFAYSFRSFNGLSPKIAALDLISNFMNLTYNDAQFLGQLARYYPKVGLKFSPTMTEAMGKMLTSWGSTYSGNNSEEFSKIISSMLSAVDLAGSKFMNDPAKLLSDGIQTALMTKLGSAVPDLISIKSALSDRPVGEWHLVVGNPMNPIFVMGDLICTNTAMEWDQEIGPDDFPTGVTFTVTLKQGKPRDKTAIERMLNAGETKLTAGMLKSSTLEDTFGEQNNTTWNAISGTSGAASTEKLTAYYNSLSEGSKGRYHNFRNRFLGGYGFAQNEAKFNDPSKSNLDDSLLLYYYQREYGQN